MKSFKPLYRTGVTESLNDLIDEYGRYQGNVWDVLTKVFIPCKNYYLNNCMVWILMQLRVYDRKDLLQDCWGRAGLTANDAF